MVQRRKVVLVWHLDVLHPVEEIDRSVVGYGELHEGSRPGEVGITLGRPEAVRRWTFTASADLMMRPLVLKPVREILADTDTSCITLQ